MRWLLIAGLGVTAASGCADSIESLGCNSDSLCPAGHVCREAVCEKLCDNDLQCGPGLICNNSFCLAGARTAGPSVTAVVGNGSSSCPSAQLGQCFADGLLVSGQNLTGAQFALFGPVSEELLVRGVGSDTQAEVVLPVALTEGSYNLVVQNAVGTDQMGMTVLQGEPGPDADGDEILNRINAGATTGRVSTSRMALADDVINHLNTGSGSVKLAPSILDVMGGGGSMTGTEIVTALNMGTTVGTIVVGRMPSGNDIISHLNATATGTPLLSNSLLEPAMGSGFTTGNQVVNAINTDSSTTINEAKVIHPDGDAIVSRINSGSGTINGARLPNGDALMARINTGSTQIDPSLVPGGGGGSPAWVVSTSAITGSTRVDTDSTMFNYCSDANGCVITIGAENGFDFGVTVPAFQGTRPCKVHMQTRTGSTRDWSVSPGCYAMAPAAPEWVESSGFGLDGSQERVPGGPDYIVLAYRGVCYLTEYSRTGTSYDEDTGLGFYLFRVDDAGNYDDDGGFTCKVIVED